MMGTGGDLSLGFEAALFRAGFASRFDIEYLRAMGVMWDGRVRLKEIPIQKEATGE